MSPPLIGQDRTVYAFLTCHEWDYNTIGGGKIYQKLVAVRERKVLWEKEVSEIFDVENERFWDYFEPIISPENELIISIEHIWCGGYYKGIFINNKGDKVKEIGWFKNGSGNIIYNTPDTFGLGRLIINKNGDVIGTIKSDSQNISLYITDTVVASNGDFFLHGCDRSVEENGCKYIYRVNKHGKVIRQFDLPNGYISRDDNYDNPNNLIYLSNDGVMVVAKNRETQKLAVFVLDSDLKVIWVEERDMNRMYGMGSPYILLPDCGTLYMHYTDFLPDDEREILPNVQYRFSLSNGIGPGKSTWPMWRGDPQNTGRVQLYK